MDSRLEFETQNINYISIYFRITFKEKEWLSHLIEKNLNYEEINSKKWDFYC